jgi:HSP20 family molecular chaperone IbpA
MLLLFEVDASKVDAKFNKGVLKITLPKPAEVVAKTKRIKINSAV